MKGFFVCVNDHRSNVSNPRDYFNEALRNSKPRDSSDLLTVSDLYSVQEMCLDDQPLGAAINDGNFQYAEEANTEY